MKLIEVPTSDTVSVAVTDADFLSANNSVNEIVNGFDDKTAIERTLLTREQLLATVRDVSLQVESFLDSKGLKFTSDFPGDIPVKIKASALSPLAIAMRECVRLLGDSEHQTRTGVTVEEMLASADAFDAIADEIHGN